MKIMSLMSAIALSALMLMAGGCTLFKVVAPIGPAAGLSAPKNGQKLDFAIETRDRIDHGQPMGKVGDTFFGGQYQVVLSDSLADYLEGHVAQDMRNAGYTLARYPGKFRWKRLKTEQPAAHLLLELQALTLSRHPSTEYFSDHVIGTCKLRAVMFDRKNNVIHQRQCVGKVDTWRLGDELDIPGIGWISRKGLSQTLEYLLRDTVKEFRETALPEIRTAFDEYRSGAGPAAKTSTDTDPEEKAEGEKNADNEDEEAISF